MTNLGLEKPDKSKEEKIEEQVIHSGGRNRWTANKEDYELAKDILEKNGRRLIDVSIEATTTRRTLATELSKKILGESATVDDFDNYLDSNRNTNLALTVSNVDTSCPDLYDSGLLIRNMSNFNDCTVLIYVKESQDITKATELARISAQLVT